MRNISTFITGLAVIALTGCGGGGGGGGSGSMGTPPPPGSASSLVAPGTFLAGPGGSFTDAADSLTFNGSSVTSASNSASGAQIGLTTDPSTGKTRFLSLNIPLGDGSTYSHTFDVAGAFAGSGPSAGLIAMEEGTLSNGTVQNTLILDPSLTFSTYGIWLNAQSSTAGATGAIAFGNMTPAAGIPTSGSATYSGKTLGTALNLAQGTASVLTGTATFNANFTTMMISGNLNLNDVTNNVAFANLSMPATNIAASAGGPYNGSLTGTLPDGNPVASSDVHGQFNGPTANETSGTWSAANSNWRALGGFGAKKQ
jgi:hypothetical protein